MHIILLCDCRLDVGICLPSINAAGKESYRSEVKECQASVSSKLELVSNNNKSVIIVVHIPLLIVSVFSAEEYLHINFRI